MDGTRPALQRLFEAIAAVLELDRGHRRLELIFENGRLRAWYTHHEKQGANELARFDEAAASLTALQA